MFSKSILWFLASATVLSCAMMRAQERTLADPSLIQGIVTNLKGREPLEGVSLTLESEESEYSISTNTDREGRFVFKGIPPGRYAAHSSKDGFFSPGPIHLTTGTAEEVDVQAYMTPLAAITGRVLDEDREAVGGAAVTAIKPMYINGRRVLVPAGASKKSFLPLGAEEDYERPTAVTDERGDYRIFGLEPGTYYVAIWGTGAGTSNNLPPEYYPGVSDPAAAIPIEIRGGLDRPGVDFHLVPRELHTFTFKVVSPSTPPYDCSVQDPALKATFEPVLKTMKAFVLVRHTPDLDVIHFMSHSTGSFRAAFKDMGENRWRSPELPPGSYQVFHNPCYARPLGLVGRLETVLADRDSDAGTLVVPPSVTVRGVLHKKNAPSVVVQRVRVRLRPLDLRSASPAMTPNPISGSAAVNDDGVFSITSVLSGQDNAVGNVAPGSYQVDVAGLPPDVYVASVRYAAREVRDSGFQVDGEPSGPLEITLAEPGGRVDGVVLGRDEKPAPHSIVVLLPAVTDRQQSDLFRATSADQKGAFTVRGIPPGRYGMLALTDIESGVIRSSDFLREFEPRTEKVTISEGSSIKVNLRLISR